LGQQLTGQDKAKEAQHTKIHDYSLLAKLKN